MRTDRVRVERPHHGNPLDLDDFPCGVIELTTEGELRRVNRWLVTELGYDPRDFAARYLDELLTKAGQVLYFSYLLPQLRLDHHVHESSLVFRKSNGQTVEANVSGVLRVEQGEAGIVLIVTPMTKRRHVEEELQRMRRAAESAPGMLFELRRHLEGRVEMTYVSPGIRELYDLRAEQVRGSAQAWFDRIHADDRAALDALLDEPAGEREVRRVQYRVLRPDGRVDWHELQATHSHCERDAAVWHGYVADITDRRRMEHAQLEKEAAQQANRAKSDFLARMSHELRTPLNAIIGFAQLLEAGVAGSVNPEQKRQLQIVDSSGQHLLRLIEDVLDITRIETGRMVIEPGPILLAAVVERSLRMIEPSTRGTDVRLSSRLPGEPLRVVADARRLEQVLVNLLSNAIKYNRPGGAVTLRARGVDDEVRIDVSDTGIGMDEAQQRDLFQPFNRLGVERLSIEGTGLGLVIARSLVEGMRGRLEVESRAGEGSCFTVWLPAATDPAIGKASGAERSQRRDRSRTRSRRDVLYVEDNAVNALLMRALFGRRPGWELRIAHDGATALAELEEHPPDLLLIDLGLPDMDGIELLRRVRRHAGMERVPAIMVSAAAFEADQRRAQHAGFTEYWTKPIDVDHALQRLDELLTTQNARRR
jgi:PAS domain S-box-containing protein